MSETEITTIPRETALAVLTNSEQFDAFYERVKAEVSAHVPDLTTEKGRKEIASLAFKVTKSKTAIDNAGKLLTEEWRSQTKTVDDARRIIRDKLDALRDETRAPLTDWEAKESTREIAVQTSMGHLRACAVVHSEWSSDDIQSAINGLTEYPIEPETFGDHYDIAINLRDAAFAALEAGKARAMVAEENARELDRLRAEAAERQRIQDEKDAKEAAELDAKNAAEAEAKRIADEQTQAEADRQARDDQVREAARAEVERQALEAAEAERAVHQAALDAANKAREDAANEAAELKRRNDERENAEAETKRQADARAKDQEHKRSIMTAAKLALISVSTVGNEDLEPGRIEAIAITIVRAIVAGEIPAVRLDF